MVSDGSLLTLQELGSALSAAVPGAMLVQRRILRRLSRQLSTESGLAWSAPHHAYIALEADEALAVVERDELEIAPEIALPPRFWFLERPEPQRLAEVPGPILLTKYWRILFHAQVHWILRDFFSRGILDGPRIRERIDRIGQAEFDEVRAVLNYDGHFGSVPDGGALYVEFVATYAELRYFEPDLLPIVFPSLPPVETIDALLAHDLDLSGLWRATRPAGAAEPRDAAAWGEPPEFGLLPSVRLEPKRPPSRWLRLRMARARRAGNAVRAAILAARAGLHDEVETQVLSLTARLQVALELDEDELADWFGILRSLTRLAASEVWTIEGRLLYDLQKTCVDHERGIYRIDLWGWLRTAGRRPLKRLLPYQREIKIPRHLRSAERRAGATRLARGERARLFDLLDHALHDAETAARLKIRPPLESVIEATGFVPANLPERVARDKLIDELVDRIVGRGPLSIGDLRDAVSRNQLKLPDLAGPGEFIRGDRLLRADRGLSEALDGVYRRGEIYLRLLQRFSAIGFGTPWGRAITLHLVIPFGGAFLIVEGLEHTLIFGLNWLLKTEIHLSGPSTIGVLGLFLYGMVHSRSFRQAARRVMGYVGRGLKAVFRDLPRALAAWPPVRLLLNSRFTRLLWRTVLKPLPIPLLVYWADRDRVLDPRWSLPLAVAVFFASSLVLNSRIGRDAEEIVTDLTLSVWNRIRMGLLANLYRFFVDIFHRALEEVERLLYSVDEWLRFRGGEGRLTLALKAVAGAIWAVIEYLIRIYVNLLVEPQLNPIKHFPVVTVSHKVILPLSVTITKVMAAPLIPIMGQTLGYALAGTTMFLLPGVFGFLVWELKENWRLYEANRPKALGPVPVGSHGETVLRLLRPGFHSGTLPKLYARLRRAERRPIEARQAVTSLKVRAGIHHVEDAVRALVERELVALVRQSQRPLALESGRVEAGSNRLRIELVNDEVSDASCRITIEHQSGLLVAGFVEAGWLDDLSGDDRAAFAAALAGFYAYCGIDLVRETIASRLAMPYDLDDRGLVVWPDPGYRSEAVYNLGAGSRLVPQVTVEGPGAEGLPVLVREDILFRTRPIEWSRWVTIWESADPGAEVPSRGEVLPPVSRVGIRPGADPGWEASS